MTLSPARAERRGLVRALRAAGPDAPTLCAGWTARDLAAHVVVRERRPDALAGAVLPPLAGWAGRITRGYLERDWTELLDLVGQGPPWYSPFAPLDTQLNLAEMFVHHEDVLRGGADPAGPWLPRRLDPALSRALELPLKTVGRLTLAKAPVRVSFGTDDGRTLLRVGRGDEVAVTGTVGELVLFVFGRAPVDVQVTGPRQAVDALWKTTRAV